MLFSRKIEANDFEQAALPHLNELYRTAVRLVADRAAAEDLVHETYMQAWKCFHRFQKGTNCRAWLFKILLNKIKHHRRKWFRSQKESEEALAGLVYEAPVPEHLCDEEVLNALDKLPAYYREVILLTDVQELSYKEVAYILGVRIGTVMSRLSRGRKLLRGELASVAESYGIKSATRENKG
ncbi:MAG: sigma-70 family RNA polymerase sigma factor [Acidobacteriota bacterium]|nr:sigma-70 family RNA polymerase sigma factor [Acidobacteriota bacterium]